MEPAAPGRGNQKPQTPSSPESERNNDDTDSVPSRGLAKLQSFLREESPSELGKRLPETGELPAIRGVHTVVVPRL